MNIKLAFFTAVLFAAADASVLPCLPSANKCYQVVSQAGSWQNASDACQQLGGNLTSIHSAVENAFVTNLLPYSTTGSLWIGGTRNDKSSPFYWNDGTTWDYSNWGPGEPNDQNNAEFCIEIYTFTNAHAPTWLRGQWNDYPCTNIAHAPYTSIGFVCEFQIPSSTILQTTVAPSSVQPSRQTACSGLNCKNLPNGDYSDPSNPCSPYFLTCSNGYCYDLPCPMSIDGQPLYFDKPSDKCLRKDAVASCGAS